MESLDASNGTEESVTPMDQDLMASQPEEDDEDLIAALGKHAVKKQPDLKNKPGMLAQIVEQALNRIQSILY